MPGLGWSTLGSEMAEFEAEKRSAYKKEKVGRLWIYTIPLEIEGIRFSILLSRNQLRKIQKQERGRIHIDFEKSG